MTQRDYPALPSALAALLKLQFPPLAITFSDSAPPLLAKTLSGDSRGSGRGVMPRTRGRVVAGLPLRAMMSAGYFAAAPPTGT